MTARERVIQSVRHVEPDRVPFDIGSNPSSGISAIAYSRLLDQLNLKDLPVQVFDVVQQLAQPQMEIIDLFGIDILDVGRVYNETAEDWTATRLTTGEDVYFPAWFKPERKENGDWIAKHDSGLPIARMPQAATFFDQTHFPWLDGYPEKFDDLDDAMSKVLWAAFAHSPWDHSGEPGFWDDFRSRILKLRETTDKALLLSAGCNLFEWGTFIRRMDNFLMDLYMDPANVERLVDALLERHLVMLEKLCESVGDIVDIVRLGDDLGAMNGPFMDTGTYQTLFKPRHKQLCDYIKKNSDMHIMLHCCGSIYDLIPDLIDAGFDILNPVQTQARNMEPEKIKKEFGKDVTFWGGGVETVGTLNNGSTEDVRSEVLKRLEILSPGGGFVFNTVHNIMPDVPPENIIAMVNAVKEFNGEPGLEI